MPDSSRRYRLTTPEKKDLEVDLKALDVPRSYPNAIVATSQRHLQRALDRRQPLWRKAWQWMRGEA
jgi:hypothetical protein